MERVTLKEYEAAKAAVLYGKEYKENSEMENNVIHKQYVCKDGSGVFYERTENGVTEFVPCICWQEKADEVAGWQQGDTVELLGRYQSRQYEKVIDTDSGSRERRTAYEISVQLINRKERAANV